MAVAEFNNSGVMIGYEPSVQENIENQLKTLFPDGLEGNVNIADYSLLFSSMLLNATGSKAKVVEIYSGGKSIIIDGTTNLISSSGEGELYDWFRSFSSSNYGSGVEFPLFITLEIRDLDSSK